MMPLWNAVFQVLYQILCLYKTGKIPRVFYCFKILIMVKFLVIFNIDTKHMNKHMQCLNIWALHLFELKC